MFESDSGAGAKKEVFDFHYDIDPVQNFYILHKKPSLSGTLCAKPARGEASHQLSIMDHS